MDGWMYWYRIGSPNITIYQNQDIAPSPIIRNKDECGSGKPEPSRLRKFVVKVCALFFQRSPATLDCLLTTSYFINEHKGFYVRIKKNWKLSDIALGVQRDY